MVAIINSSTYLYYSVIYNERKVQLLQAVCLEAGYFPIDAARLSIKQKLARFRKLARLNQRAKATTITISLNFAPGEDLSKELLKEIAGLYLEKIGFGGQPYLLYQHFDAGHPHVHIVTTTIKPDGQTIMMHNIRTEVSPKARREIEIAYALQRADDAAVTVSTRTPLELPTKVVYGRKEITASIAGVLENLVNRYLFTSLNELNGLLCRYNLRAYEGKDGSPIKILRGLLYQALGPDGKPVGVPIKASTFGKSYTIRGLEKKFASNAELKLPLKRRTETLLLYALHTGVHSLEELITRLRAENIELVLLKSNDSTLRPDRIILVDHHLQIVFRASELSSAASIQRFAEKPRHQQATIPGHIDTLLNTARRQPASVLQLAAGPAANSLLAGYQNFSFPVTHQEPAAESIDPALKRKKRKKKKWFLANQG